MKAREKCKELLMYGATIKWFEFNQKFTLHLTNSLLVRDYNTMGMFMVVKSEPSISESVISGDSISAIILKKSK